MKNAFTVSKQGIQITQAQAIFSYPWLLLLATCISVKAFESKLMIFFPYKALYLVAVNPLSQTRAGQWGWGTVAGETRKKRKSVNGVKKHNSYLRYMNIHTHPFYLIAMVYLIHCRYSKERFSCEM